MAYQKKLIRLRKQTRPSMVRQSGVAASMVNGYNDCIIGGTMDRLTALEGPGALLVDGGLKIGV